MKKSIKILMLVILLLLVFIGNLFVSTGYFRSIEPYFNGEIVKQIDIPGAEDITISHQDSFAIISSTKRGIYPPKEEEVGDLFLMDLKNGDFTTTPLTASFKKSFAPHGISMLKLDDGYKIMAINHTSQGHSIEVFNLKNKKLSFQKTLTDKTFISPNDIVMIDENRFYFTNDHKYTEGFGRLTEDYLGRSLSNIIYFDGTTYREVANGIAYANGINYDSKRNLLFVASPRKFLIKVYDVLSNGDLEFIEDIDCGTGVDNIEFDKEGQLWVGAHPNLLKFTSYAKGKQDISPSEIIKINYKSKNDYSVETIYLEDGTKMSASTVAAPFGDYLFSGNVMDDAFLILKKNN
jgi:arylesterase/paraoxonase